MEKSKKEKVLFICLGIIILFLVGFGAYGWIFKCGECPKDDLSVENNITSIKYWKEQDGKYVEDTNKLTAYSSYSVYSDEENDYINVYLYGKGKSLYLANKYVVTEYEDDCFKDNHLIRNFESNIKTINVVYFKGQSIDDVRAVIVLLENGDVYISDFIKENSNSDFYKTGKAYEKSVVDNVLEITVKNRFDNDCADGGGCYLDYIYALDNTGNYYYLLKGYYE